MAKTYQRTKLQEVTIRGYKSIAYDRPVTLKLGDVSILLGANGAGKSNIISFFRMLSYMMSKSFGRYVEISGTSHALLHYGIKRTPVMSGELKFADSNSMDVYGFSLANATPDRLIITEERITSQSFVQNNTTIEVEGVLEIGSHRDGDTGFISQLRLRDARFRTL